MKIDLDNAPIILVDYMETEMLPKASGFQKLAVGMAIAVIAKRASTMVKNPVFLSILSIAEVVDKENNLDIDATRELITEGFSKSGKIHFMGCIFSEADVETLHASAQKFVKE